MELEKPNFNITKGFCGIGVYQPKTQENIGTLIRSAKQFGADFVFTIGKRYKTQHSDVKLSRHIPIFNFKTIEECLDCLPPTKNLIGVDIIKGSQPLKEFKHPKQGIYILGSEDNGLCKEILTDKRFEYVHIEGKSSLNLAVAGSIILYDRFMQFNDSL